MRCFAYAISGLLISSYYDHYDSFIGKPIRVPIMITICISISSRTSLYLLNHFPSNTTLIEQELHTSFIAYYKNFIAPKKKIHLHFFHHSSRCKICPPDVREFHFAKHRVILPPSGLLKMSWFNGLALRNFISSTSCQQHLFPSSHHRHKAFYTIREYILCYFW